MLIKHIRYNGRLIGTVVALDRDAIGWSQCCPKDLFNRKRGIEIAEGRALKGTKKRPRRYRLPNPPTNSEDLAYFHSRTKDFDVVKKAYDQMIERANKYYK